ncbi:MAG: hypothetical protein K2X91_06240, partial [Thermoleophilia bacterium]|nr:hypothetical protein [Thermoleophilia bacterium]
MTQHPEKASELSLSGRSLISRVTFTRIDPAGWVGAREGALPDDGRQPFTGDLRLSATLDPDARVSATREFPCVGNIVASIFDGVCWQRFDLTSLTTNTRFNSAVQLQGALRWACTTVQNSAGRVCRGAASPEGFFVFSALARPVQAPATADGTAASGPSTDGRAADGARSGA